MKQSVFLILASCFLCLSVTSFAQKLDWVFNVGPTTGTPVWPGNDVFDIEMDASKNIYICGKHVRMNDFDPGTSTTLIGGGHTDSYIAKYDSGGNFLWAHSLGDTSLMTSSHARSIEVDGSGNVVMMGSMYFSADFDPSSNTNILTSNGDEDVYLAKYTTSGSLLWAKNFGGVGFDFPHEMQLDANGNIYVVGAFEDTMDVDPSSNTVNLISNGNLDQFIAKYDASGNYLWAHSFGDTANDVIRSMTFTSGGNFVVSGSFGGTIDFDPSTSSAIHTANAARDVILLSFDGSGNYVWSKSFGNVGSGQVWHTHIRENSAGDLILAGSVLGAFDFDPSSNSAILGDSGAFDIYIAKYSSTGSYLWGETIGSSAQENAYHLSIGPNDEILLSGEFRTPMRFDPHGNSPVVNITAPSSYIASYGDSAKLNFVIPISGGLSESWSSIMDDMNYVYAAGSFSGTTDFDPSSSTYNLSSGLNYRHFFLSRYSICFNDTIDTTVCHGGYYHFPNGDSSNIDMLHVSNFPSMNSCDSLVVTNLQFTWDSLTTNRRFCFGENFTFPDGSMANSDTTQISILTSSMGCDSVITTKLTQVVFDLHVNNSQNNLFVTQLDSSTYQWIDCDNGNAISGANSHFFQATRNGNFAVIITRFGCSDTSNCAEVTGIGIEEHHQNKVFVYPNPVEDLLNIEGLEDKNSRFILRDNIGREIKNGAVLNNQVDLSDLDKGVFHIYFQENNGRRHYFRVVK